MSICETIKSIRKKCFLSQEAFAKELGVSFTTVNRWETGKSIPTYKTLKLINEYCKRNDIPVDLSEITWEACR